MSAYTPDLPSGTVLEDAGFFNKLNSTVGNWLKQRHWGLLGWMWVAIGSGILSALCCISSFCSGRRRQRQRSQRHQQRPVFQEFPASHYPSGMSSPKAEERQ
jgi:hypothetical protein